MPKVSVIMACYNGMPYLKDAVNGILCQTLTDFEFIIVDDASTDDSVAYLRSLQDPRIQLLFHETNKGQAAARNTAIDAARGEYVINHDQDDISHPTRLEQQVHFMDTHPDVVISGCSVQTFGMKSMYLRYWSNDSIIKALIPFKYMFFHPVAIYRRQPLENRRYPLLRYGEDLVFVAGAALKYKASNIRSTLFYYRIHSASGTFTIQNKTEHQHIAFAHLIEQRLGFKPTPQEVQCHIDFVNNRRMLLRNPAITFYLLKALIKGQHTFFQRCVLATYFVGILPVAGLRHMIRRLKIMVYGELPPIQPQSYIESKL